MFISYWQSRDGLGLGFYQGLFYPTSNRFLFFCDLLVFLFFLSLTFQRGGLRRRHLLHLQCRGLTLGEPLTPMAPVVASAAAVVQPAPVADTEAAALLVVLSSTASLDAATIAASSGSQAIVTELLTAVCCFLGQNVLWWYILLGRRCN